MSTVATSVRVTVGVGTTTAGVDDLITGTGVVGTEWTFVKVGIGAGVFVTTGIITFGSIAVFGGVTVTNSVLKSQVLVSLIERFTDHGDEELTPSSSECPRSRNSTMSREGLYEALGRWRC